MHRPSVQISLFAAILLAGTATSAMAQDATPQVLFINSYHAGYNWSDGIQSAAEEILAEAGIGFQAHYMDTKLNPGADFIEQAAREVVDLIEQLDPDLVITSDDNAASSVIAQYYQDADLPFVFTGINWDASAYGFPYDNVTGMVEIDNLAGTLSLLEPVIGPVNSIGYLSGNESTNERMRAQFEDMLGIEVVLYAGEDFADFQQGFLELQQERDLVIISGIAAIPDWNDDEAARFFAENTTGPSVAFQRGTAPYAMFTYVKIPEEQGIWAATAAIMILNGLSPSDIPITQNSQGSLLLNRPLVAAAGIEVPDTLLHIIDDFIE